MESGKAAQAFGGSSAKDFKDFVKDQAGSKAKQDSLKAKIFPVWNGHVAKIFDKTIQHGKNSDKITLHELMILYPGAQKFGEEVNYEGPGGKQTFIQHIDQWLQENMLVNDMMTFTRYFSAEISRKFAETKNELRAEVNPRMAALETRVKKLESEAVKNEEINRKRGVYERELVLFDPEGVDLNDPNGNPYETVRNILGVHYNNLHVKAIQHIRKIEDTKSGQERYAVIMATFEQREVICFNASKHDTDKDKIRRGIPPHIRAEQVKSYPLRVAAHQFNYESQHKGEPVFFRVEKDPKTGVIAIKKYNKDCPQVSQIKAKADKQLLVAHPHFKNEVHRNLFPSA